MGSSASKSDRGDEGRPVEVTITKGFWMGKYEITQSEWRQVMGTEQWKGQPAVKEGDDFPATFVSWEQAMEFCHKLTIQEHKAGRVPVRWEYTLPTEAQWERACRAGTETRFNFGDDESKLGEHAWFRDNAEEAAERYAHRIGQKKPNQWGLHDMHGKVFEWCRDIYGEKLPGGRDPEVTIRGFERVLRSGCWRCAVWFCPSAFRGGVSPSYQHDCVGFRVALSPSGKK